MARVWKGRRRSARRVARLSVIAVVAGLGLPALPGTPALATPPAVRLAPAYTMKFHNITYDMDSDGMLSVASVDPQGNVTGSMTVNPPLGGTGPLRGTLSGSSLTFTVSDGTYQGVVDATGTLSGTYTYPGQTGAWTATPGTSAPGPTPGLRVAALGDSYSSGNGTAAAVPPCYQSPTAWPNLVPGLVDAAPNPPDKVSAQVSLLACSGAQSSGTSADGQQDLPAQIAQLRYATVAPDIVTLTIGGDDGQSAAPVPVGFRHILEDCSLSRVSWLPLLHCLVAVATESNWIRTSEPNILYADFAAVHAAAPAATLLAVGYPTIFKDACPSLLLVDKSSVTWMNELTGQLDTAIANAAARVPGARYVDTSGVFAGHELCSGTPWVVPPLTVSATIGRHDWVHPTEDGQNAIARAVAGFILNNVG